MEISVFQFEVIASCPVTGQDWKDSGSIFFALSHQIPLEVLSSPDYQSQLTQPLLAWQLLQSPNHLHGTLLDEVQYAYVCLVLGSSELDLAL